MEYTSVVLKGTSGKLLLQLRENKKGVNYPGFWGFFGGAIEGKESPKIAALRELKEELNLNIKKKNLKKLFECESIIGKGVIFLDEEPIEINKLTLNEGAEMKLFNYVELRKLRKITPELKKYIKLNKL